MMTSALGIALLALALSGGTVAFVPIGGGASTHISITGTALLQKVTETCRAVVEASGHEFKPTGPSPEELVQACLGPTAKGEVSGAKFHSALQEIYTQNGLVDRDFVNSAPHHFNSESFLEGRSLIIEGMTTIKANIRKENFQAARERLGRVLHTIQDFYSHSNWVELGYTEPYINLMRPDLPLENLADVNVATCSDCASGTCPNPILPNILKEKKLTSGYMGLFSDYKPKGKCSHGGAGDLTSAAVPRGGISKDERRADNLAFHTLAVNLATTASLQLLDDIRLAVGDNDFLRMMGIARSSVVCFVIDTTGSMSDDIDEAREVVYEIIDSKKGTQDEPSEYILVPFNDPKFGPMIRTTDPDTMKTEISKLRATGGGDEPEMCLSGLQLALTGAPASSHIYVFTDATAKDIALKDTIVALIRSTKSTVSFFMTGAFGRRRRSLRTSSFQDYKDLALASGGQAIQVAKNQLPQATDVILDTSTSALVTVLQRARNPGKETFPFMLDESLKNITIYITGKSITFTLTNPAGVIQSHTEASGSLGTIQTVGNLRRIRLNTDRQTGPWKISIESTQAFTLKITGQSTITFIYDFVERFEGPHPGYAVLSGRPQAGQPSTLMLSVMGRKGPSSMTVKDVGLVTVSGPETVSNGTTTDMGNGAILVTIDKVPEGEFVVILRGIDKVSNGEFQRQSNTQMSVSKVNIQAVVSTSLEPGKTFELPFSVVTQGSGGQYSIGARNDRDFPMKFPNSLTLTPGQYSNATLTITPPTNTPSGTDVTLTIEIKSSRAADSNYAVLRFSVVTKMTDFVQPSCEVVSVKADGCPLDVAKCGPYQWELSASLTDGNGTGIEEISLRQGNGSLTHTSLSAPVVQAEYKASCCSQIVEFVAVDKAGNVGKCFHSIIIDVVQPSCEVVSVKADACFQDTSQCGLYQWELTANLTDGNGTGIESFSLRQGDGKVTHTSLSAPVVQANYRGSCCSQIVEFVAVDKVGNVGKCFHSIDVVQPSCEVVSVKADACFQDTSQCGLHQWELSASLTDGNGTGVESVSLHQGDGNLTHTSLSAPVVQANYRGSCCSQIVEIVLVDKAGNVGKCFHSIDVVQPSCEVVSVKADDCPKDVSQCGPYQWELTASLTDGNGTGIESVSLHQGDGNLTHTSLSAPVVQANYRGSCCSQIVEIVLVDKAGNVGKCFHSIDVVQPSCEVVSVKADDCPKDVSQCGPYQWELTASLTDGNGTGIESVSLHQGDGNLTHTSLSAPVVQANYRGSCCSQIVEIVLVDKAGNVGKCFHSIDVVQPSCEVVSVKADDCPKDVSQCGPYQWELTASLTDGNGTGIESVSLHQGDGKLMHSSLSAPVVQVNYRGSCCSQIVEFVAVDKAGNVGKCFHSIAHSASPPALTLHLPLWLCLLTSAFTGRS